MTVTSNSSALSQKPAKASTPLILSQCFGYLIYFPAFARNKLWLGNSGIMWENLLVDFVQWPSGKEMQTCSKVHTSLTPYHYVTKPSNWII